MVLSVVDGLFTVHLIESGLQELNPALAPFVHGDAAAFAMVKVLLTAVGVVALVLSAHAKIWRRLPVSRVFYLLAFAYLCVIAYEIYLVQYG